MGLSPSSRTRLLQIARVALLEVLSPKGSSHAGHDSLPDPSEPDLNVRAGCFVSLHDRFSHRLRGCVGRIDPKLPLWEAVRQAASEVPGDPRFAGTSAALSGDDVPDLEIEVSVLSAPHLAASAHDFDPLDAGLYLVIGQRGGFFLPQVARETGWDREHLLDRLCTEKLGLPAQAWRGPDARLYTFDVEVVGPERV